MNRSQQKWSDVMPVFVHILAWTTLLWMILLSLAMVITLNFSLRTNQERIDTILRSQAVSLASSISVRNACESGVCTRALVRYLDMIYETDDDLTSLTIANTDCIRVYHVEHDKIGLHFVGGDQYAALQGRQYFSDATGALGPQRRYFCPVLNDNGTVIGFVMAGTAVQRINELRNDIYHAYVRFAGILAILTVLFSLALAYILQSWLNTVSPNDLLRLYLTKSELLDSLDEGLLSLDGSGNIQFLNRSAEAMLDQRGDALIGKNVDSLIQDDGGNSLLLSPGDNKPTSFPNIMAAVPPLQSEKKQVSRVIILKDKTELFRQAEQLNGSRHIIESLRANNHEFMNRLQVISGLIQIGRYDDALEYISNQSTLNARSISPIMQKIYNPSVAALLLGKLPNARERDISVTLLSNSYLPQHSAFLSTADLVTVIGNLLENAIEAVNIQEQGKPRNIALQITEDTSGLFIEVSDSGVGIAPENVDKIFQSGFSTKAPEGRGIGMYLIDQIVTRNQGTIDVDTEVGCGTTFTLIFNKERTWK